FMCHPCHFIWGVLNSSAPTNLESRGSTRSDPHCWSLRHESQCGERLVRLSSHCRRMRYESQCGEKLPFARSVSLWWVARRYCPPDTIVLFVYRTRKLRIHTAGERVTSRSVAKGFPSPRSVSLWWVARRYSSYAD
ncbi:hypothetical protein SAMN02746098_05273, partial [Desulfosporosinus lacus DSM 15449]